MARWHQQRVWRAGMKVRYLHMPRVAKKEKKKNPCPIRKISRERKSLIADSNISHLTKDTILGQRVFKLVFYHISKFD